MKRGRGRGNRRSHVPNRNHTYDSNGPDVRIRGNAHQVYEKYLSLARDATASGDRVLAESCFQHAEHYFRILKSFSDEADERQRAQSGARPTEGETTPVADHAAQPVADKAPVAETAAADAPPDPADQLPAFVAAPQGAEDSAEAAPKPRRRRTVRAAKTAAEGQEPPSSDDQSVAAD